MEENLYAVILAGGSGSRLWPLSRELYPKQLLKLDKNNTLFQSTFLRLLNNFKDTNIVTITNIKHIDNIKLQLNKIKKKFQNTSDFNIVTEPIGRNTAPAIALSLKYIQEIMGADSESIVLVAPSDHIMKKTDTFADAVESGIKLAKNDYIVTFGVKPDKIDSGFGYIKTQKKAALTKILSGSLKAVEFKEKPDFETAKKYVESDNYYCNSGIFIFKVSVMLEELKKYSPDIYKLLKQLKISKSQPSVDYDSFEQMPDISIDYAVMEKSEKIVLIPMDCEWKDLGSWEALYDISKKDKNNNYITGNVLDIDSKDSMIYSTSKLITTLGLKNKVVIDTDDALLVCDKSKTQSVKEIYFKLKEDKNSIASTHKTVYRPWGYYTVLQSGKGFLTKCIQLNPKAKLSLQMHHHRSEHWVVLQGRALVIKGEEEHHLTAGQSINIKVEEKHSLQNPYKEPLKILEVQKGDMLSEDDIVRFEDIYGRVTSPV